MNKSESGKVELYTEDDSSPEYLQHLEEQAEKTRQEHLYENGVIEG